ncbi:MAG: carboxysome shell carbonic anhydrase, partial [Thioalkalispiraceae bacterium]
MLSNRRKTARNARWSQPSRPTAPLRSTERTQGRSQLSPQTRVETRQAERVMPTDVPAKAFKGLHPLTNQAENQRLHDYEQSVKSAFDAIVPTLKRISAIQHEEDFVSKAQSIAREQLGFDLPEKTLADAWVEQL